MLTTHGALGATFHLARLFQGCSLIAIIGMTANFISTMVSNDSTPPNILIGTITVVRLPFSPLLTPFLYVQQNVQRQKANMEGMKTSVAVIYCIITTILLLDNILPFLACAIMDLLVVVALIIVSVLLGKPLSYLKCQTLSGGKGGGSTLAFTKHLGSMLDLSGGEGDGKINYANWIGASKSVCLEMKAIWGLCIALW